MKYVLELLRGKTTYNSRSEAISALDSYPSHRAGQPVVVIYKKNGNSRALLAIGTGPHSYTIIGDADGSIDITSKISARDIVLDEIDYSGLLDDLGKNGEPRFGWLGTEKDPWGTTGKIPSGTTVQEAFEAILVGRAQEPEPEPETITYTVIYKCEGQVDYIDVSEGTVPELNTFDNLGFTLEEGKEFICWENSEGEKIEELSQDMFTEDNNYTVELTAVIKDVIISIVATPSSYNDDYDGEDHLNKIDSDLITVKTASGTDVSDCVDITKNYDGTIIDAGDYTVGFTVTVKAEYTEKYQFENGSASCTVDVECTIEKIDAEVEANIIYNDDSYQSLSVPIGTNVSEIGGKVNWRGFIPSDGIDGTCFLASWNPELPETSFDEVNTYVLEYTGNSDKLKNYNINYIDATLTVEEAPLEVTYTTGDYNNINNPTEINGSDYYLSDSITAYTINESLGEKVDEVKNTWNALFPPGTSFEGYNLTASGIESPDDTYLIVLNHYEEAITSHYPTTININKIINLEDIRIYVFDPSNSQWTILNMDDWSDRLGVVELVTDGKGFTINYKENSTSPLAIEIKTT